MISADAEMPRVVTWHLEEIWTIDANSSDAPLMGVIKAAKLDASGNIFLLDYQLSQVLVISPEGEYLRTLSHEGEGPGETRHPQAILLLGSGELGLLSIFPAAIVRLDAEGLPLPTIRPEYSLERWWHSDKAGGVLVIHGESTVDKESKGSSEVKRLWLAQVNDKGEKTLIYHEKTVTFDWGHPKHDEAAISFPDRTWAIGPDGVLVLARSRDDYRLEFITPDGVVERVVTRSFDPYVRTDSELKRLAGNHMYMVDGKPQEVESEFLPTARTISGLQVVGNGDVWVMNCYAERDLPKGIARRYDVFSASGKFVSETHIAHEYNGKRDLLWYLGEDLFLWVYNGRSVGKKMMGNRTIDLGDEDYRIVCLRARPAAATMPGN